MENVYRFQLLRFKHWQLCMKTESWAMGTSTENVSVIVFSSFTTCGTAFLANDQ